MDKQLKKAFIKAIDKTISEYRAGTHICHVNSCAICLVADQRNHSCRNCIQPQNDTSPRVIHCFSHLTKPVDKSTLKEGDLMKQMSKKRIKLLTEMKKRLKGCPDNISPKEFRTLNQDLAHIEY